MNASLKPVGYILIGMIGIASNDVCFKLLSGDYSLYQLVATRSILSMVVLIPIFVYGTGGSLRKAFATNRPGWHAVRCVLLVLANTLFFAGLASLPLAESSALVFMAPLVVMCLAHFVLGEKVGPIRWAMLGVAACGMILVVQPFSASFQMAMIFPLCAALCYGCFTTVTRYIGPGESTSSLALYPIFGFLAASIFMGVFFSGSALGDNSDASLAFLFRSWQWPAVSDFPYLLVIGLGSATIATAMAAAYRIGEASFLAPFEYIYLLFALILGYAVWRDFPNWLAFVGILLILGAGVTLAWREVRAKKRAERHMQRGY